MADYFTNLIFIVPLKDQIAKRYALDLARIAKSANEDTTLPADFPRQLKAVLDDWWFEVNECEDGIWIHSDCGGVDAVCPFVQHLLQKFNPVSYIGFELSQDCTKPRTDAYGGGAAFITATDIQSFNTATWLESKTNGL